MSIDISNPAEASKYEDEADKAVVVTEDNGLVYITLSCVTEVVIPRDLLEAESKHADIGKLVVERLMLDLELDRDGTDPLFVPAINKKLAEHLAKG
jgi:hypothetical protein